MEENEQFHHSGSSETSSGHSQESPWLYYGRTNRLMMFGTNAIAVAEDGSKMVIKMVLPESAHKTHVQQPGQKNHTSISEDVPPTANQFVVNQRPPKRGDILTEFSSPASERRDLPEAYSFSDIYTEPEALERRNQSSDGYQSWKKGLPAVPKRQKLEGSRKKLSSTSSGSSEFIHEAPSTPDIVKLERFKGNLTVILSAIYAVFIVTVGVVVSVADLMVPGSIGEVFSVYLLLLGLSWFIFLHLDLLKHCSRVKKQDEENDSYNLRSKYKIQFPELNFNGKVSQFWLEQHLELEESGRVTADYMFNKGRHSGSFFLKIGAAGFCFGHLIHSSLILSRQILHFTSEDDQSYRDCADIISLTLYILYPIYSFYQLYLIFKYSNVIINRFKEVARFGLMHCLATSLYFWFSMILRETVDSLHHHKMLENHENHHRDPKFDHLDSTTYFPVLMNVTGDGVAFSSEYAGVMGAFNGTLFNFDHCAGNDEFSALILHISPYLYPFSIEYSILVVGIWFIMWQNIGKVHHEWQSKGHDKNDLLQSSLRNTLVIYADCHSANRGLFAGLFVLVATVVSLIIFFVAFTNFAHVRTGLWINLVSETTLLVLMFAAALVAYKQLSKLDVNAHPISLLDDLLLFICIPCFFLYGIFSIVPAMVYSNYMSIFSIVLQVAQVILQTPFIIDGLRRCSNNSALRERKPGRELITFLIVCNIAMWIIETFEIKSHETNSDRILFYGYPLWAFLSHVTLPLTLFYRFHSSVCLVDIWKSAYERGV